MKLLNQKQLDKLPTREFFSELHGYGGSVVF